MSLPGNRLHHTFSPGNRLNLNKALHPENLPGNRLNFTLSPGQPTRQPNSPGNRSQLILSPSKPTRVRARGSFSTMLVVPSPHRARGSFTCSWIFPCPFPGAFPQHAWGIFPLTVLGEAFSHSCARGFLPGANLLVVSFAPSAQGHLPCSPTRAESDWTAPLKNRLKSRARSRKVPRTFPTALTKNKQEIRETSKIRILQNTTQKNTNNISKNSY